MANTSSRTLRLLSLLQNHRHWRGATLSSRLGISERTLRRDIERLRDLGYPVTASRGVDGGYRLGVGVDLPPLLMDDDEAVALAVGLHAAAQGGLEGIAEASVRALAKVMPVLPARLRQRVEAIRAMTVPAVWAANGRATIEPDVLTTIALACRDNERLEFSYVSSTDEQTRRHVEPHRLVALVHRWYLVAYDVQRGDWRTFRLDRLSAPRTTGVPFRRRSLPATDAAAFVRAGILRQPPTYIVEGRPAGPTPIHSRVKDGH